MMETAIESLPQAATQWYAMNTLYLDRTITAVYQNVSVLTSTLVCGQSVLHFVVLHRRKNFISDRYPTAASLIPIFLYSTSSFIASTLPWRFVTHDENIISLVNPYYYLMLWTSLAKGIFFIVFLCSSCSRCRRGRIPCTIIHLLVGGFELFCLGHLLNHNQWIEHLIYLSGQHGRNYHQLLSLFYIHCVCCIVSFVMGILVLPCKELAPCFFAPILGFLSSPLRKILSGFRFHFKCEEMSEGHDLAEHIGENSENALTEDGRAMRTNKQNRDDGNGAIKGNDTLMVISGHNRDDRDDASMDDGRMVMTNRQNQDDGTRAKNRGDRDDALLGNSRGVMTNGDDSNDASDENGTRAMTSAKNRNDRDDALLGNGRVVMTNQDENKDASIENGTRAMTSA